MRKYSKWYKFKRVFKRKLLKPLFYAICVSFALYILISNITIQKRLSDTSEPHFVISRVSDEFDETEFMHMLLTIQEIRDLPAEGKELKEFVNSPAPSVCPKLLAHRLYRMNWTPDAFLARVKKLFAMNEVYERVSRLDETIAFLSKELDQNHLPAEMWTQTDLLKTERNNLIGTEISQAEYDFMHQYHGIALRLQQKD